MSSAVKRLLDDVNSAAKRNRIDITDFDPGSTELEDATPGLVLNVLGDWLPSTVQQEWRIVWRFIREARLYEPYQKLKRNHAYWRTRVMHRFPFAFSRHFKSDRLPSQMLAEKSEELMERVVWGETAFSGPQDVSEDMEASVSPWFLLYQHESQSYESLLSGQWETPAATAHASFIISGVPKKQLVGVHNFVSLEHVWLTKGKNNLMHIKYGQTDGTRIDYAYRLAGRIVYRKNDILGIFDDPLRGSSIVVERVLDALNEAVSEENFQLYDNENGSVGIGPVFAERRVLGGIELWRKLHSPSFEEFDPRTLAVTLPAGKRVGFVEDATVDYDNRKVFFADGSPGVRIPRIGAGRYISAAMRAMFDLPDALDYASLPHLFLWKQGAEKWERDIENPNFAIRDYYYHNGFLSCTLRVGIGNKRRVAFNLDDYVKARERGEWDSFRMITLPKNSVLLVSWIAYLVQLKPGVRSDTSEGVVDEIFYTSHDSFSPLYACRACTLPTDQHCSVCKAHYYCSVDCQAFEWPEHRKTVAHK